MKYVNCGADGQQLHLTFHKEQTMTSRTTGIPISKRSLRNFNQTIIILTNNKSQFQINYYPPLHLLRTTVIQVVEVNGKEGCKQIFTQLNKPYVMALSTINHKPDSNLSDFLTKSSNPSPNSDHRDGQSLSPYASSTDNIARLLQGWTELSPKKEQSSQLEIDDHIPSREQNTKTISNDRVFRSLFGSIESMKSSYSDFSQTSMSSETSTFFEHESKPLSDGGSGTTTLSVLEKWLFEDYSVQHCGSHCQDEDLKDMPLQEDVDFL